MADYCTDVFQMVEDTDDSFRMWQGLVGPYYVPIMSNDGTLRWTNNGGLPNPSEVNLMGPQGAGIRIAGIRASTEELPATAPAGDIWLVGEGSPYEGWTYSGEEWIDLGALTVGPAGPPGPQGDSYELTESDKQEIAELAEDVLLTELDNDPLGIRYGGTGARDLAGAKANLDIDDIEEKLGDWPLGTDAQDVSGAINEMIGEISLQVADIQQLQDNFAGEFSPTSTYAVGAYVVYGGAFWRCTTAVSTAGSWTGASNWEHVTAGGEFEAVKAMIQDVAEEISAVAEDLTAAEARGIIIVSISSYSGSQIRVPASGTIDVITADHVVLNQSLGTPTNQKGPWTVMTYNGYLTLSGPASGATSVRLVLGKVGTTN